MSHKILIGQFLLEANTFAPGQTNLSDFEKTGLWIGNDLKRKKLPEEDELAAAWYIFQEKEYEKVPSIRAWIGAGPTLSREALNLIEEEITKRIDRSVSGVFLSLPGAAAAEGEDDPEGYIQQKI